MRLRDIFEVYSEPNSAFRRYMTDPEFDPFQHWYWVAKWLEENDYLEQLAFAIKMKTGKTVELHSADDLMEEEPDVFYLLPDNVQQECGKDVSATVMQHDPASASTHDHATLMDKRLLPRTTWLVHFSDNASDIQYNGFTHGSYDMSQLGLTTWSTAEAKKHGGYNFAFKADSKEARWAGDSGKYGRHAVLFQNSGVVIDHHGDNEQQIVFWGKDVNPQSIILLIENGSTWNVMRRDRGNGKRDELFIGSYRQAVDWVKTHYQQYRNVL